MLGREQQFSLQFQEIVDGILIAAAFWLAFVIRYLGADSLFFFDGPIPPFNDFRWLLYLVMPFGPIILELQGFYHAPLQKSLWKSLGQLGRGAFWLTILIGSCVIFLRLDVPSRAVLLMFPVFAGLLLLLRERCTNALLRRRAQSGRYREDILLAGLPIDVAQLRRSIADSEMTEMNVVGEIDIERQPISDLVEALHRHSISRVIFAGGHSHLNRVQEAIAACEVEGVEAWLIADFIKTSIARPTFDSLAGRPMLVFRTTPELSWALLVKAMIDRVGAALLLLLTLPFMVSAAIGTKLSSPGPVIFKQRRAGRHGRPFFMYKFRSMCADAEDRRVALEAHNQMSGPVFKLTNDPRVTKFGRWLRVTSIDELPQLINVLKGEMSLVGPRPLPLYEVEKFESTSQRRRLSVRPGLTCLWQVSGRNQVKDFQDWVRLDLEYIDNWSIWLDLKILARTVPVVVLGLGAR